MFKVKKGEGLLFVVLILFLVMGCIMVWSGVQQYYEAIDFGDKCIETTGYVIGREWSLRDGEDVYSGIYEYVVDGTAYTITEDFKSSFEPENGDTDSVWYNPTNPADARFEQYDISKSCVSVMIGNVFVMCAWAFLFGMFTNLPSHVVPIVIGSMFTLLGLIFPLFVHMGPAEIILYIFGIVGLYMVAREVFILVQGDDSEEVKKMDKEANSFVDFLSMEVVGGIAGRHSAIGGILFVSIFGLAGLLFGWVGIGIIRGGEFFMGLVVLCMFGVCPVGMATKEIHAMIDSYKRQKNNEENAKK